VGRNEDLVFEVADVVAEVVEEVELEGLVGPNFHFAALYYQMLLLRLLYLELDAVVIQIAQS